MCPQSRGKHYTHTHFKAAWARPTEIEHPVRSAPGVGTLWGFDTANDGPMARGGLDSSRVPKLCTCVRVCTSVCVCLCVCVSTCHVSSFGRPADGFIQ